MKTLDFRTRIESWESQSQARRMSPAIEAVWHAFNKEHSCVLGAGSSDALYAFIEGNYALFLAFNSRLEYCGLEVYDMAAQRMEHVEVLLQGDERIKEVIGPKGLDYTPMTIARRLFHLMGEFA